MLFDDVNSQSHFITMVCGWSWHRGRGRGRGGRESRGGGHYYKGRDKSSQVEVLKSTKYLLPLICNSYSRSPLFSRQQSNSKLFWNCCIVCLFEKKIINGTRFFLIGFPILDFLTLFDVFFFSFRPYEKWQWRSEKSLRFLFQFVQSYTPTVAAYLKLKRNSAAIAFVELIEKLIP